MWRHIVMMTLTVRVAMGSFTNYNKLNERKRSCFNFRVLVPVFNCLQVVSLKKNILGTFWRIILDNICIIIRGYTTVHVEPLKEYQSFFWGHC